MFLMDTRAQIGIARILGKTEAEAELHRRFKTVNSAMLSTLWNETLGVFQNSLSQPLQPIERLAGLNYSCGSGGWIVAWFLGFAVLLWRTKAGVDLIFL
jgi:hypothetical protein